MSTSFVVLHIAALMQVVLLFFTLSLKKKSQIYYVFIALLCGVIIWSLGNIITWYQYIYTGKFSMGYVKLWYLGNCFIPAFLYYFAVLFKRSQLKPIWPYALLLVPPAISYLSLLTNEINGGLFYRSFSLINTGAEFGPMFLFHSVVSYIYIGLSIFHLLSYTSKTTGFFSKQSILMLIAFVIPGIVNVVITSKAVVLPVYYTSIGFTVTNVMFALSIIRYQFLSIPPIVMQTVLDRMADGFTVVNEKNEIIYCNNAFLAIFKSLKPKLLDDICSLYQKQENFGEFAGRLAQMIGKVKTQGQLSTFEQKLIIDNEERYFQIDVIPIKNSTQNVSNSGLLVFFKDITQIQKAVETVKRNQAMLMEQQHLASLGQLIGGIAHNLRTPIMSISGGLEAMRDLVREYQISIGDDSVTQEDHREIAAEMHGMINKIKPFCSYMSDIISAVKDQAVRLNESSMSKFTVSELLKRIEILMKLELNKHYCVMNVCNLVLPETELPGTMNNLIQIISNIIINAIESYEESAGKIDLIVEQCSIKPENIRISIRDYGPGIPESVRDRVFKEMITTKGTKGTGIGLYMSHITIKGKFGGDMWFETQVGQGTTFHISIPALNQITPGVMTDEKEIG